MCTLHLARMAEDTMPAIASSFGDTHNHISMSLALAAVCWVSRCTAPATHHVFLSWIRAQRRHTHERRGINIKSSNNMGKGQSGCGRCLKRSLGQPPQSLVIRDFPITGHSSTVTELHQRQYTTAVEEVPRALLVSSQGLMLPLHGGSMS